MNGGDNMLIDFHYHLATAEHAVEDLITDMDHAGVDVTNLFGGPPDAFWEYKNCYFAGNDKVLEAVRRYPDRLSGAVYLDPREPDAIETFDRYLQEGFRCVKMFPPSGFQPDDERWFPLYERIEAAGVPLIFHAGQTNIKVVSQVPGVRKATNSRYSHPLNFDMIARIFPGLPIVLAHMGYPHYVDAWSVAHANPNIHLDISGSGPWTEGIPVFFNAVGGHHFIPVDFHRVIWGSDNCLTQAEHHARSDVYMRQMGADSSARNQIFGETAKRLLKR
jgi:predicted TIM-barrel fold metal-dependent hydrolase